MPADDFRELTAFLAAWAIVAACAVPVFVVTRGLSRREGFWPRWRPVPFRGTLLDWLLLYTGYVVVMSLAIGGLEARGVVEHVTGRDGPGVPPLRAMAAGFVALPALLAAAAFLRRVAHDVPVTFNWRAVPGDVARGVVAGVVFTPAVHAIYALTRLVNAAAGGAEQEHPLALMGAGHSPGEVAFFLLSVGLAVPWVEELLFRGVMLRWLGRRAANAALVFAVALLFAGTKGVAANPDLVPMLFVVALAALTVAVGKLGAIRPRFPARTTRAVLASSALFASAHSAVWPSPVPLFVLACGLGYLTARTGRITAAVVAHGLFNAVSSVILIRQAAD